MINQEFKTFLYQHLNPIEKQDSRQIDYQFVIDESIILSYDIENMDKPKHDLLESILYFNGYACIGRLEKDPSKIVVGFPTMTSNPPINDDGVIEIDEGITISGNKIIDACLIRANSRLYPFRKFTTWYSMQLSKIDFSQWKLAEKSVCNPIPFARSQKVVDSINQALSNSGQTDMQAYLNDSDGFGEESTHNDYDLIDFTNIAYTDKFKFLSSYHDDLTRRIYFIRGFASQSPTKLAQTNDSELQNRDDISMIFVNQEFEVRKHDMEVANSKLGTNFIYKMNELLLRSEPDNTTKNDQDHDEIKEGDQNEEDN